MAGPKKAITAEPLTFDDYPTGRADRRLRFISEYVITPRGVGAREPFNVRAFQDEIVRGAFAPGIAQAVISLPRGNGKSGLAAALGVAELWIGGHSAEVLIVASDERQARIIFEQARRMIELNPLLSERCHVYQDRIYVPETDSTLRPLPADYDALQGWDPTLMIIDELHTVSEDVWSAVTSAAGKREESLVLAISTPGKSKESVMWRLVEYGRKGADDSFYLKEYAAPDGCDVRDREYAWKIANPALADPEPFMQEKALVSVVETLREPVFRQLRLGQWAGQIDTWLPFGAWEPLADTERVVMPGERIVMGFDGSTSGDSTALVGCTVDDPHLFVIGVWEKPPGPAGRSWKVPRHEVHEKVKDAFDVYDVRELACDPWGWQTDLETWASEYGAKRVISWPTSYRKRMAPATDRMFQAVVQKTVTHDGSERLAAHLANAVAVSTPQGDVITKDKKHSPRKIDLAVAAIVALDRGAFHSKKKRARVVAFK